jgi:hypothetical protein
MGRDVDAAGIGPVPANRFVAGGPCHLTGAKAIRLALSDAGPKCRFLQQSVLLLQVC